MNNNEKIAIRVNTSCDLEDYHDHILRIFREYSRMIGNGWIVETRYAREELLIQAKYYLSKMEELLEKVDEQLK